jgi:hypothetical protein
MPDTLALIDPLMAGLSAHGDDDTADEAERRLLAHLLLYHWRVGTERVLAEKTPGMRMGGLRPKNEIPAPGAGFAQAADGTRTHDLLHGNQYVDPGFPAVMRVSRLGRCRRITGDYRGFGQSLDSQAGGVGSPAECVSTRSLDEAKHTCAPHHRRRPQVVRCDSGCDRRRASAPAPNTAVGWELLGLVAALPIADEAQRDGGAAIPEALREPIALSWLRRLSDVGTVERPAPTERSTP